MIKDEWLSLPENWELVLEHMMLSQPNGQRRERTYICSPCLAGTTEGVIRNIKAARVYMFYVYQYFPGVPKAPHAFLPILLNDIYDDERSMALRFGKEFLMSCSKMFVCGDRVSDGMYSEAKAAALRAIPIQVFNENVHIELRLRFALDGVDGAIMQYDCNHLHLPLSWSADKLAPYWEEAAI